MYSGLYTASINCCKNHFIATTAKLRSLKWLIQKTALLFIWSCIDWLHNGFRTRTGGWEFWLLPWLWHTLSIPLKASRGISAETCGLVGWCVSSWRPWFLPVYSIYYLHTIHLSCNLSNWNKLFLKDIHTKSWCGHARVLDDLISLLFPVWFPGFQLHLVV